MSAPNFSYDRRCVLVPDDRYETDDYPALGKRFDNDRTYPSHYLEKYEDEFSTVAIVLTTGYYSDACIDIRDRDDRADELLGYVNYYSGHNRQELVSDICYWLGCSPNFANTRLKGCRLGGDTYEYDLEKAFQTIVDDWHEVELRKANKVLDKIKREYRLKELTCVGVFSNGEAWYDYIK